MVDEMDDIPAQDKRLFDILEHDDLSGLQEILQQTDDVNITAQCPIPYPENDDDPEPIAMLRDKPTAISIAAYYGAAKCFNYLQNNNADLSKGDEKSRLPVHFAAAGGNNEICDALDNAGGDWTLYDQEDRGCVDYACLFGHIHLLQRFDERNFDLTKADKRGWLPVHYAAIAKTADCIAFLKEKGADINVKAPEEQEEATPLTLALLNNSAEVFKFLLAQGVDTKVRVQDGRTPLQDAAFKGNTDIMRVLLENPDIDINEHDNLGWSALIWAVYYGQHEAVRILVDTGKCNVNQYTIHGYSAVRAAQYEFDIHHDQVFKDIEQYIRDHGGVEFPEGCPTPEEIEALEKESLAPATSD